MNIFQTLEKDYFESKFGWIYWYFNNLWRS